MKSMNAGSPYIFPTIIPVAHHNLLSQPSIPAVYPRFSEAPTPRYRSQSHNHLCSRLCCSINDIRSPCPASRLVDGDVESVYFDLIELSNESSDDEIESAGEPNSIDTGLVSGSWNGDIVGIVDVELGLETENVDQSRSGLDT